MSSASLLNTRHPHAQRAHPDPVRIAGLSVAIALNLAVVLMATRPLSSAPMAHGDQATPIHWLSRVVPAAVAPPPAIELKPLPHPVKVTSTSRPKSPIVTAPVVLPATDGRIAVAPSPTPSLAPTSPAGVNAPPAPAIEASLAYRSAPLQFPLQAMRTPQAKPATRQVSGLTRGPGGPAATSCLIAVPAIRCWQAGGCVVARGAWVVDIAAEPVERGR
ncbi:MAG: hypothetical protein WDW38_007468 [Sanguina aurantia]